VLDKIFGPLEYAVSWVLVHIHSLLTFIGLPEDSGWSWGPSIVLLVILVRILLIPLFVKQIRSQRGLQLLQPKMAELRKKYGNDRQRMSEELMKLYKETGTNPFSSCLPILAQSPFFFGLYRVLDGIANNHSERGVLTPELIASGRRPAGSVVPRGGDDRHPDHHRHDDRGDVRDAVHDAAPDHAQEHAGRR
jgi:YidC/Oxa1 family membrane protein insertase